ncbi:MAG: diguanylate cyclase [Reyranellaceae bacterium]
MLQAAPGVRLPLIAGAFVTLVCLALLALGGWWEWMSRQAVLTGAEVDVSNLSRSLGQHAEDTFELADSIVLGFVHRLETEGTGPQALDRLQSVIELRKASLGRIRGLFVYDAEGRWLATSEDVDLNAYNNSDRAYFQKHQTSPDKGPLIGEPVRSRSGGQWIITVSRRFDQPDGTFAGVVLATIDAAYFADFYRQFDVGPRGAVALIDGAGRVMAHSPDNDANIGRSLAGTPLYRDLSAHPAGTAFPYVGARHEEARLGAYARADRFPVVVLVSEATEDALAEWRSEALARSAFVAGLTVLIAWIGFRLVRQLAERHRLDTALANREADFRLLAEESSDMVMRVDFDERIRYVSPSCERTVGWTAGQLLGTPALAGVNPEDLPRVRETVEAVKRGELDETRMVYRTRHRVKGEIWLETALHATREAKAGAIDGVVAISRDVTAQKDVEQKLATLAAQDGLTGLANRRRFDEKLREEWLRARRDGTALSLLLIDVDHFKRYNDEYGHQAGDDCLRTVGGLIAAQAQRPADLAARYGGEEFALLLPGSDSAGCAQIGERIREALHGLGLPHPQNPPSRRVTVSLGGATDHPTAPGTADAAGLVATADNALYAAKRGGRDRLVMAGEVVAWPGRDGVGLGQ